jgi:hypothetical protein
MRNLLLLAAVLLLARFASSSPQTPETVEWGSWWTLLPFEHPKGGANVKEEYGPEEELRRMRAGGAGPKLERNYRRKDKFVLNWQQLNPAEGVDRKFGVVNFNQLIDADLKNQNGVSGAKCMAYAYRTITSRKSGDLKIKIGSDDGCLVWMNGKPVYSLARNQGINPTGEDLVLPLKKGVNHLLVKVANEGGGWGLHIHPPAIKKEGPKKFADQTAINEAIDRGVLYLLKTQLLDGSWGFNSEEFRNGTTALATYALLKSGLKPSHPCIRRAFQYMDTKPTDRTYALVCELLARKARGTKEDLAAVKAMGATLEEWENNGFAYPTGSMCLSNTQYGAMGLLLAQREGAKISPRTWENLIRCALRAQKDDGGFSYRSGTKQTGSMTAAGLIILRVSELAYEKKGVPTKLRAKVEDSIARGMDWMEANFRPDTNPKGATKRWDYYYLYGVERMAALYGLEMLGTHDWYGEGATFLVKAQGKEGNWATAYGESEPNTAFGLIFLDRATAALTGGGKKSNRKRVYATKTSDSQVVLRASGDTPLSMWVSSFQEEDVERHSRTVKRQTGLYIDRVEYFADGELVNTIKADSSKPWKQERFAMQHKFNTRREHTVQVKVHLTVDPDDPESGPVVLSSPELAVRVDEGSGVWMLDYPDDWLSNLLLQEELEVTATSEFNPANGPAVSVDGRMGTGWVCAADDADPTLTIKLDGGARGDRLVFSHRTSAEVHRGDYDRATRLELRLNGSRKNFYVVEMNPDEDYKTEFELPKVMRVHELSIRVIERITGTKHPGKVGFAEIEFRLGS